MSRPLSNSANLLRELKCTQSAAELRPVPELWPLH